MPDAPPSSLAGMLRPVTDDDAETLIALVGAAYAEYPGCVLDLPGIDADLRAPATTAARAGSRWWVTHAEDSTTLATIGAGPPDERGRVELKRLYVAASARRRGLGGRLVGRVVDHASGLGACEVELWSDTRFTAAHRLYEVEGFARTGRSRGLDDPSDTTEWQFVRELPQPPRPRSGVWEGPAGRERCTVTSLPDGRRLVGAVAGLRYEAEVDDASRPRRLDVEVERTGDRRRLTSDGAGRWWLDGRAAQHLAGCLDVWVEGSTAILAAALGPASDGHATRPAVAIRARDGAIEPITTAASRLDEDRWRVTVGHDTVELVLGDDGLPIPDHVRWTGR